MLTRHVAIVSESKRIQPRQLMQVSAALQQQATRDLGPIWDVEATVDPFERLADVPLGYWPIIVQDKLEVPGAAGVHEDRMGQPFALVQAGPLWSLTASHECLEMLVDPFGNRTVAGYKPSIPQDEVSEEFQSSARTAPERVEFLVEICDPCEDFHCSYSVNGIPVSDFYTPNYFEPYKTPGVRYDFTGAIDQPRKVLENGYLSWSDPVDQSWWQYTRFSNKPRIAVVGAVSEKKTRGAAKFDPKGPNVRSSIDFHTETPLEKLANRLSKLKSKPKDLSSLLTQDGWCSFVGCASSWSTFSQLLDSAWRSGKLLDDRGGTTGTDRALLADSNSLREDINKAKKGRPYH